MFEMASVLPSSVTLALALHHTRSERRAKHNDRYSHDAIDRDGEHLRPIERLVDPGFYS